MIVAMSSIQMLGHQRDLPAVVADLQRFGAVEVAGPERADPSLVAVEASSDLVRIEALLARVQTPLPQAEVTAPERDAIEVFELEVDAHEKPLAALRSEEELLRHYVEVLAELETLIPELAKLSDAELQVMRLAMVALLLDDPSGRVVAALRTQLTENLGDRFLLVSAATSGVRGCLLVMPGAELPEAEKLLGTDQISRVLVPEAFAGLSLHSTVSDMRARLDVIVNEQTRLAEDLATLRRAHAPLLLALRRRCHALVELEDTLRRADLTDRAYLLRCWVPTERLAAMHEHLTRSRGSDFVVLDVAARDAGDPPVLLHNRRAWGPFQRLVGFLSWPSPQGLDPTGLMAVTLPFLFGVMVGDVVYGIALSLIGWWLRRRAEDNPLLDDVGRVLLVGGAWSFVFGILFGEALGSLGNTYGMPAVWFYRGGPEALEPLLLFALALGVIHIVLGLVLGVWVSARQRNRHRLAEAGGTLAMMVGLLAMIGALVASAPALLVWSAGGVMVVGVVVASASHGALGVLLGPLEMLGTLGNVLSYLRLAAVGLASVYLANVANELAAQAPLVIGLVVATLLHGLNLALAAFSPMVQALRLHYVEFFSKFHTGGGRNFTPLGAYGAAVLPILASVDIPSADSTPVVLVGDVNSER